MHLNYHKDRFIVAKIGVEVEVALNVPLHGCDLLDNHIGRLHTNF